MASSALMTQIDYQALFSASPYPYLVVGVDFMILAANDAYLHTVRRTAADIVGRHIFDAFPPDPTDPAATNTQEVSRSIKIAIATGKPDTTAFLRYAVPVQTAQGTGFEPRYWSAVHTPICGPDGQVTCIIQNAIDVTELYTFDAAQNTVSLNLQAGSHTGQDRIDRAQMHEAMVRILNDERGHLRSLFDQSPGFIAVLKGQKHVFEMVNDAYYQLVGHRELVGKPVWEALPEVAGQGFEKTLDEVYATGVAWVGRNLKLSIQRTPEGPLVSRYIDLSYQPIYDENGEIQGLFAQGHDVTEAYEARQAQFEIQERLEAGMQAAKMLVWDLDVSSGHLLVSDNAQLILGAVPDSLAQFLACVHADDVAKLLPVQAGEIMPGSPYAEVVRYHRPDTAATLWLDIRGNLHARPDGVTNSVRGVMLDITERMHAEQKLREADRRKDEFLAMLAHELRNPLAPISTAAQLLKAGPIDEQRVAKASTVISRQVKHMTSLVDDLLDVSRVTRGLVELSTELVDIKPLVNHALEQARPLIESRQHDVTLHFPADPAMVRGDRTRLVQVLTNVLQNAAKYTPQKGQIKVAVDVMNQEVIVKIHDDGIGMEPALLPRVFDLFAQAERTPDRSQGGLGLGLALVKSMIALHGGKVSAHSEGLGSGSTFTVILPQAEGHGPTPAHDPGDAANGPEKALDIMVVDDNVDAAESLAALLDVLGHRVRIAPDGMQALKLAKERAPEVFFLDIGLPDMDGYELARRLRASLGTASSTLLALTGYGQANDRVLSKEAGFSHHFVKPMDVEEMMTVLGKIAAGANGW